ncbi:MAG: hypothetical protein FWD57_06985 [Polyangiaceae bacterium]|nr:hypothetical protein [Polyangiaceae bacterium]
MRFGFELDSYRSFGQDLDGADPNSANSMTRVRRGRVGVGGETMGRWLWEA